METPIRGMPSKARTLPLSGLRNLERERLI